MKILSKDMEIDCYVFELIIFSDNLSANHELIFPNIVESNSFKPCEEI